MRTPLAASATALSLLAAYGFHGVPRTEPDQAPRPGQYYCQNGTNNETLTLDARGSFVAVAQGCFHREEERGTYVFKDGMLILRPQPDADRAGPREMDRKLFPVRWGAHQYLIADRKMLAFCSQIAAGWDGTRPGRDVDPYYRLGGKHAYRLGERNAAGARLAAAGVPEVPASYRKYLRQPFAAHVISVWTAPVPPAAGDQAKPRLDRAWVDKGSVDGVVVGTPFGLTPEDLFVLRVIRVKARRAECEILPWGQEITPGDKVVPPRIFL